MDFSGSCCRRYGRALWQRPGIVYVDILVMESVARRAALSFRHFHIQYASLVATTLLLMYHGFVYDLLLLTYLHCFCINADRCCLRIAYSAAVSLFRPLYAADISRAIRGHRFNRRLMFLCCEIMW